jgi:hypothetical protein
VRFDDKSEWPLRRHVLLPILAPLIPPSLRFVQRRKTFTVTVRVVNLLATVRDAQGRYVASLRKDDFVLREDGHVRTIGYSSDRADTDGRYRKIALEIRHTGLVVRTRDGYYPSF